MLAPPLGDALSDQLCIGRPHVLATAAAILTPATVQVGSVEGFTTNGTAAIRAVTALALDVQPSW